MIKYLLSFLSLFAFLSLQAQTQFKPEWNVGLALGMNFPTISFVGTDKNTTVDTKMPSHIQGGIAVRYITEKNLGIIGELLYSQQGWDEKFDEGVSSKNNHRLDYLTLPILTHIYFGNNTRFFINIGPQLSFLIHENQKTYGVPLNGSSTDDGQIIQNQYGKKADKKFDYGLLAGLGLECRTKIGNFSLEGRYYLGFGDIYNNHEADVFSRSANRVISARLTYYTKLF